MKRQKKEILEKLQVKRAKYQKLESEGVEVRSDLNQLKYELNGQIGINRFPFELMNMILKRLKLRDLFACGSVCGHWNAFVKAYLAELVISELKGLKPIRWKFSNQICSPESTIIRHDLHFDDLTNSFLIGLKRLKIINCKSVHSKSSQKYNPIRMLSDLHFVNQLVNLQILEVSSIEFEVEATLSLSELRTLVLSHLGSRLKLSTPQLSNYRGKSLELVEFVYKEKVTHLWLDEYHEDCEQLPNLEYLCLKGNCVSNYNGFLADHASLKILSIRPDFRLLDRDYYHDAKSDALDVLEQKELLKREDFQLILFGVQLELEQIDPAYEYNEFILAEWHIKHYSALCSNELRWVKRVHLSSLWQCLNDGRIDAIPSDFYEQFGHVEQIVLHYNCLDNEEQIEALKKFKQFNSLIVQRDSPGDEIDFEEIDFDQIAGEFPQIRSLSMLDVQECDLNSLDFVFRFKKLRKLVSDSYYTDHFVARLFDEFEAFTVVFKEAGTDLMVTRSSEDSSMELWQNKSNEPVPNWTLFGDFDDIEDLDEAIRKLGYYDD